MTTTQIDLDDELLAQAADILGTATKKATVNEALRRLVALETQLRHLDELASGAYPDLADPEVMASAWQ
ncbi:type II toxin-antitoxin system VapB family antitoxin [Streptomyces yaizuensis]|uniref:Type II toxin-antitoxin system VapB family antitoxin n=1 Tax=Streptomyces yaizuensis TaxID=2989713 RepID=A0ABQ5NWI2_9ACTN|nr:type II toxin-antitoxin system VapB family antitoxin [Streptomyces sp. YSPA8]GLF94569.1 type II toxin-antitoxin system VapB family antitoxin [Streptomyces sp. YSPA8]